MSAAVTERQPNWGTIVGVLLLAAALRLGVAAAFPGVVHPDETIQYLEQAYRVATGRGLVPWEYQVGARSWLLPGLLVPVVAAARAISHDPVVLRWAVSLFGIALSLASLVAAAILAGRTGVRGGAWWAAVIAALSPELAYFAPHVLADTVAATTLIVGLAVAYRQEPTRERLVLAGLLLGLTLVLRPQLGPAVAIVALGVAGGPSLRRYANLAAGGLVAVGVYGLVDWLTWGMPFGSIATYVHVNAAGVADVFGRSGPTFYVMGELATWRWAALPVLATAAIGARRAPLIAIVAAAVLLTFSAVGHKEYRFLFPALPLLFLLCGIGTAELVGLTARWRVVAPIAAAVWIAAFVVASTTPAMRGHWQRGGGAIAALDAINRDRSTCGVAVIEPRSWAQAGRSRLRDDLPLRTALDPRTYDTLLFVEGADQRSAPAGYGVAACHGTGVELACVRRRPGECVAADDFRATPDPAVEAVLHREGLR